MFVHTSIPRDVEAAATECIGCAIEVHRRLGPGYLESIYRRAMCLELESRDIPFEAEKAVTVTYREWQIPGQRIDLIVRGKIVLELKAVRRLKTIHRAQVISYLKTTDLRLDLLINFKTELLRQGIKRVVL
jgi:GxxExxY protein